MELHSANNKSIAKCDSLDLECSKMLKRCKWNINLANNADHDLSAPAVLSWSAWYMSQWLEFLRVRQYVHRCKLMMCYD